MWLGHDHMLQKYAYVIIMYDKLQNAFLHVTDCIFNNTFEVGLHVWRGRVRRLATGRLGGHAFEPCHKTYVHVVHNCWLISRNKFNLLSWLLAYLSIM